MQSIAIINNSKRLSGTELVKVVNALRYQINKHFAPIWAKDATLSIRQPLAGDWPVYIDDTIDVAGIDGYHEVKNGIPYAKVLYNSGFSYTLSHEVLEMLHNPYIKETNAYQNDQIFLMEEVADATNKIGYKINGVEVSNFVTPDFYNAYHNESAKLKYDYLGLLKRPLEIYEGGFLSWFTQTGQYYQAIKAKGKLIVRKLTGAETVVEAVNNPVPYIVSFVVLLAILIFRYKRKKS